MFQLVCINLYKWQSQVLWACIWRQIFSNLNDSDSDESDVESSEVLAVKRSRSSFVWKYDAAYLHFGFIARDDAGVPKPQCVVCGVVLSYESMKPSHLKRHLLQNIKKLVLSQKSFLKGNEVN